jgi:hypothetical protein
MSRFGIARLGAKAAALLRQQTAALPGGFSRLLHRRRREPKEPTLVSEAEALRSLSRTLEERFLGTGVAIEQLAQQGEEFVKQCESLSRSATGRDGGSVLFLEAMRVIECPLEFLNRSHPQTEKQLKRLRQDRDRIGELINVQVELQRTISPLKYIQSLFKIESAQLTGDVQVMFGALTKDIDLLHNQICDLFDTKFRELHDIQVTVGQVADELQTQTDSLWRSIAKEKVQIDGALEQIQRELISSQARDSRVGRASQRIRKAIQDVVTGLQSQDIINQKLQHTCASLVKIDAHRQAGCDALSLKQFCQLEAEQLRAMRMDLSGSELTVKGGVKKVLGHLQTAENECLSLEEFQHLTTSADGMVEILIEVFSTLRKQLAATVESSSRAFEKLRPIGGHASDLTGIVRNLSQSIRLIGLNAQVQAAQVQEGVGLEVLSALTSEISRATNEITENVAAKLDRLAADLDEDVKSLEAIHAEALRQQGVFAVESAQTERALHALRDSVLATLMGIGGLLETFRENAQTVIQEANYVETADRPFADLQVRLRIMAKNFGRAATTVANRPPALVQQFRAGYTMASQRKVFASVVEGRSHHTAGEEHHTPELFGEPTQGPSRSAVPEVAPPAPEIISSPTLPQPARTGAVATPAELGENVELF